MDFRKLTIETFKELTENPQPMQGYSTQYLALNDLDTSLIYIFKDEYGTYHMAIENRKESKERIADPNVNGLEIRIRDYKLKEGQTYNFIDISCKIKGFLSEFCELVREIAHSILVDDVTPAPAVNKIISNWKSFWGRAATEVLSEEDQIGLICELLVLNDLCQINPRLALESWTGPLGDKHDFNLADWSMEVKGTRRKEVIHTINGIEQLVPAQGKNLCLISFQLMKSTKGSDLSLPSIIARIQSNHLDTQPVLLPKFNNLLLKARYNPVHATYYRAFSLEIVGSKFFEVNDSFPKLVPNMLLEPMETRVRAIRYKISLDGLGGVDLNDLNWGDYFY